MLSSSRPKCVFVDDGECNLQQRDTKKSCWLVAIWCWLVYLTLAGPGHPHEPGSHLWSPPHLLMCGLVYSPSAKSHQKTLFRLTQQWARGSSLSSRAKVTSVNSHCECHLPSVKVKYLNQLSRQWNGRSSLYDWSKSLINFLNFFLKFSFLSTFWPLMICLLRGRAL